ncbi:hypothetical protein ACFFRR_003709 [Megaselia abdita]
MALPKTYVDGFHGADKINEVFGFKNADKIPKMEYKTFNHVNLEISKLVVNGTTFSCVFGDLEDEEAIPTLKLALMFGVNYIHSAPYEYYDRFEEVAGKVLKEVPRSAYYISTKVGKYSKPNTFSYDYDFTGEKTRHSVEKSLRDLGIQYIDIVFIEGFESITNHDIIFEETLPALEALKSEGKIGIIGLSNDVQKHNMEMFKEVLGRGRGRFQMVSFFDYKIKDDDWEDLSNFTNEQGLDLVGTSPCSLPYKIRGVQVKE